MAKAALPIVLRVNVALAENITSAETDALELAVGTVRKSATTHTHDVSDIIDGAADAEVALIERGVPATQRVGIRYICRSGGPSASSYGHSAIGSEFIIVRRRDCWRLESYKRISVMPGDREKRYFEARENVRECLIKNAVAGFTFVAEKPSVEDVLGHSMKPDGFGEFLNGIVQAAKNMNSKKLEPAA